MKELVGKASRIFFIIRVLIFDVISQSVHVERERARDSSLLDESREVCRHVPACMLLCGDGEKGVKALKEVGQKKDGKRRD